MCEEITNVLSAKYEFDDATHTEVAECTLTASVPVKPDVLLSKIGSPAEIKIGGIATYYVTVTIGAGDDAFGSAVLVDTPDESMEFIDGTLKIDGVLAEIQDISNIVVEFHPNTIITLEYQCVRIS